MKCIELHSLSLSSLHYTLLNQCVSVLFSPILLFLKDLLVRLVSVDLHTFGPEALMAVKLIEHQSTNSQVAEVRPQLVENVPPPVQGASVTGERSCFMYVRIYLITLKEKVWKNYMQTFKTERGVLGIFLFLVSRFYIKLMLFLVRVLEHVHLFSLTRSSLKVVFCV